jgi:hypothetical protein
MGAQKLECDTEKNNKSLLSNVIHCSTQITKIDLSECHGLIYGIEFAIYARSFLEDLHKMRTSRCGVADYVIFMPALYDIIF